MDFTDGYIYVSYSHLHNAADDMVQQTKYISTILATLEAELLALKETWVGDDRTVYDDKQQAWNQAVIAMQDLLESHSHLLTDVSDRYSYSERSLTQLWEGVRIGG